MCKQLDWQIDCAAQVCSALSPALFGVEKLALNFYGYMMQTEWQNGEIDGTTWHELLRPFISVKELHICNSLSEELSRALEVDGVGSDPGFLPGLQKLTCGSSIRMFDSFIHARQIVTNRLADYSVMVPPPSIFSQPFEPSSSETSDEDDAVASSIASSNDTLTTPPPSRRRPRPGPYAYNASPTPPGLEYPLTPLMGGGALPTFPRPSACISPYRPYRIHHSQRQPPPSSRSLHPLVLRSDLSPAV